MRDTKNEAVIKDAESAQFAGASIKFTITEKGSVSIKTRDALDSEPVKVHLKAVKQIRLASVKR